MMGGYGHGLELRSAPADSSGSEPILNFLTGDFEFLTRHG